MSDNQTIDTQALSELMRRPLDDPSLLDASAWRETVLPITRPVLERVRQGFARERPGQPEFSFSDRSDIKSRRQNYDSMFPVGNSGSPKLGVSIGLDDDTDQHTHHLFAGLYLWGRKEHIEKVHRNLEREGVLRPGDEVYQKSGKSFGGTSLYAGLFLSPEEVSQAEPDELVDQIVDTLVEWADRLAMLPKGRKSELLDLYNRSKRDEDWWEDWHDRCLKREQRLPELTQLVKEFQNSTRSLAEFSQAMHDESIQHPYWGFKGISGGMFLNLLAKAHEAVGEGFDLAAQVAPLLSAPATLGEGGEKIRAMVMLIEEVKEIYPQRGLSPGYIPYFLTFFWQVQEPEDWLVYWPQTTRSFLEHLGWFERSGHPAADYLGYHRAAEQLREELTSSDQWDAWADNHAWWEAEGFTAWWNRHSQEEVVPPEVVAPSAPIIDRLNSFMLARGFFFPRDLLTSYYLALQSKPFVILSGISGTGKTKLAQLFSEFMNPEPTSRAFVPVRPDWTDPRGLIGFHHLLTGTYHSTEFLQLLLRAHCDTNGYPHFVLLDEMNLARVEYYFSDFLSTMESRQFSGVQAGTEVDQASFPLHDQPRCLLTTGHETGAADFYRSAADQKACVVNCEGCPFSHFVDRDYWYDGNIDYADALRKGFNPLDFVPPRVTVPLNAFFTGTVNVDETTYSFSPKVLDRASVLEFNKVDLVRYFEPRATKQDARPATREDLGQWTFDYSYPFTLTGRGASPRESDELGPYRAQLAALVKLLTEYHMHFGYRVADEILTFLANAQRLDDSDFVLKTAFDRALLQKVLPKFHGSRARLRRPLLALLAFCAEAGEPLEGDTPSSVSGRVKKQVDDWEGESVDTLTATMELGARLPKSAQKLLRLLKDLDLEGFAGGLQ